MRKFSFLMIFLLILAVELFPWDDFSSTSPKVTHYFPTDAVAALGNAGNEFSMKPASVLDPATVILLGSGLVGLFGLGRKKTNPDRMEA